MNSGSRKGWCPGALRPMMARDGLLVRLRLTSGRLAADKAQALAALAAFYGNGLFDLSARANLQIRGVKEDDLSALQDALFDLGLLDADAEGEAVRNVLASPLAGGNGHFDITPAVTALEAKLVSDLVLRRLPSKFGFLIDDGSEPSLAETAADVRFDAVEHDDGSTRFWIGLGGTRFETAPLGFCQPDEIAEAAAWIGRTFLELAEKTNPPVRRMAALVASLGRYQAARAFGGDGSTPRLPPPSTSRSSLPPVGPVSSGGMVALGLAVPYGRLDHTMLSLAADVASHAVPGELRLTPWRCFLLPGVAAVAPGVDLKSAGFILDPGDPRLRIAACTGNAGCNQASTATHSDADELLDLLSGFNGSSIAIHVSGCEKGCAKASRTPVTLVGREGSYDLISNGTASSVPLRRGLSLGEARTAILSMRAKR